MLGGGVEIVFSVLFSWVSQDQVIEVGYGQAQAVLNQVLVKIRTHPARIRVEFCLRRLKSSVF